MQKFFVSILAGVLCAAALLLAPPAWASTWSADQLERVRAEFLESDTLNSDFRRLLELERQALALLVDEPLKLGSLGAAILDIYATSQTGHLAMLRYYEHLEAPDARADHQHQLESIQAAMRASGSGEAKTPYRIMTIYDAHAYSESQKLSPVGSIYQSSEFADFGFLLIAQPDEARLRQVYFDLSHMLKTLMPAGHTIEDQASEGAEAPPPRTRLNPWEAIRVLAADMDSAAQTAIGAYLSNAEKYDDAVGWLKVASRSGNILANTLLARIYWTQSESASDDALRDELRELSLENHLSAITMGSTDSMYTLANLYVNGYYGEDNKVAALPLLEQAGERGHAESLIYLAHLYNAGVAVETDKQQAQGYFRQAVATDHPIALLSYGRFLVAEQSADDQDADFYDKLENLANGESANATEAMILLANLNARQAVPKASIRSAVRWYKKAVRSNPLDPDTVNEVAWTLTVTDVPDMKRTRYAHKIMTRMMEANAQARERPEYLDTWAATYAARGDFVRAVELQQSALEHAQAQGRDDVLDILTGHLERFETGETITEPAP